MTNINILALINNNAADVATTSQKSYMDKSMDNSADKFAAFNNVLESANKNYSSSTAVVEKKGFNDIERKRQPEDTRNVKEDKKEVEKPNDREKPEEIKNKDNNKVENKQEETSSKDENNEKGSEQNPSDEKATTTTENTTAAQSELSKLASSTQQIVSDVLATIVIGAAEGLTEASTTAGVETKTKTDDVELNVDLSKVTTLPKDVDALNEKQKTVKVQPQTQQAILNMEVQSADKIAKAIEKTPMVQVSEEVLANSNSKSTKEILDESLKNSGLTQDLLDKTNATVVSVTTSNSTGGNLLNQQNAQEQGVKIALANTGSVAGTSTAQVSFDKTVETVQQPKELSKTDILAQIHTKLDALKDEGTTKVTIVLKPESLGKINLELINGKDGLTARMTTESAHVKELLDKNLGELSSSLGKQGVNVNNVSIKVAEAQNSSNEMLNFNQQQSQQENQQNSSNNSGHSGTNNNMPFEEDFVNTATTTDENNETISSHSGQVDYKI